MNARLFLLIVLSGAMLVVPATANAAPPNVTPSPTSVDFGAQSVNQSTGTTEIQFQNTTAASIDVFSFGLSGPDSGQFQVSSDGCYPQTLPPGNWCSVYIYLQPSIVGNFTASADIFTDQGTEAVPLTGEGAAGSFSGTAPFYQPQPYYWGSQYGSAQFQNTDPTFTVQGYNATITGPDATDFSLGYNGCQNGTWFPGNSCNVDVYYNPPGPGTGNAQLNLFNSGDPNPATVPLTATSLNGPKAVLVPKDLDFGPVALGSSSPTRQIRIENHGDFPLEIQQVFVVGSLVDSFPVSDNQCEGNSVNPGSSCSVGVAFAPGVNGAGRQNGTIFVITNSPGPVSQGSVTGVGYASPDGYLSLQGEAMALKQMTCATGGFPAGTEFAYSWFRGKQKVGSARDYQVSNGDIGSKLSCSVVASNPAESRTVTSSESATVVPADLSNVPGGLVGERVCRALQAPPKIGPGTISYGVPVTPTRPLVIKGKGEITATLDGKELGSGKGKVKIPPREMDGFSDGGHSLSVASGGKVGEAEIALSGCQLAARSVVRGSRSTFKASSSVGMDRVTVGARGGSRFSPKQATGRVYLKSLGTPGEVFLLAGKSTSSNGISVRISKKNIQINGLPNNTGVVRVNLGRRSFKGKKLEFATTLKSLGVRKVRISAVRR